MAFADNGDSDICAFTTFMMTISNQVCIVFIAGI
jgi:hypothetical protein